MVLVPLSAFVALSALLAWCGQSSIWTGLGWAAALVVGAFAEWVILLHCRVARVRPVIALLAAAAYAASAPLGAWLMDQATGPQAFGHFVWDGSCVVLGLAIAGPLGSILVLAVNETTPNIAAWCRAELRAAEHALDPPAQVLTADTPEPVVLPRLAAPAPDDALDLERAEGTAPPAPPGGAAAREQAADPTQPAAPAAKNRFEEGADLTQPAAFAGENCCVPEGQKGRAPPRCPADEQPPDCEPGAPSAPPLFWHS
jgi:hypothetical protein